MHVGSSKPSEGLALPGSTDRARLTIVSLTSPFLWFGLVPLAVYGLSVVFGFSSWVLVAGGLSAMLLIAVAATALRPQVFAPRTTLGAELSRLGSLVRGGFGLFVAAVVGAIGAMAVQRDFTPATSGQGEIMSLFAIVCRRRFTTRSI